MYTSELQLADQDLLQSHEPAREIEEERSSAQALLDISLRRRPHVSYLVPVGC